MSILFIKEKQLQDITLVDNGFIRGFMPSAPELAVKAYLYGLMLLSSARAEEEDIAAALGCTEQELKEAFVYWERVGLIELLEGEILRVRYIRVSEASSQADVKRSAKYGDFVRRLQAVLGTRVLTGSELSKIYDWLDVFGFEQEAAIEIVRFSLDKKGAKTGVAYMDKVAKNLASKGAFDLVKVRECFTEEQIMESGAGRLVKRWHRRALPTEDEIALYEKWVKEWGFDEESISAACAEMTGGTPSFKYLDGILSAWHSEGGTDIDSIRRMQKEEDTIAEIARQAFARAGLVSRPSAEQKLKIKDWLVARSVSPELILLAAELSRGDSRPFVRMNELIEDWYSQGISSVNAAKERTESATVYSRPNRKKNSRALNYIHGGKYSEDDLKKLGISLGEEFYDDEQ